MSKVADGKVWGYRLGERGKGKSRCQGDREIPEERALRQSSRATRGELTDTAG